MRILLEETTFKTIFSYMFDMEYIRLNINVSYAGSFEIIIPAAIVPDNLLSSGLDGS